MDRSPKIIATRTKDFMKKIEADRGEDNPMTSTYRRVFTTFAFTAHSVAYIVGNTSGIVKYRILNKEL